MDDAVLSCGGRIISQRNRGESVLVVTVFTGGIGKNNISARRYSKHFTHTDERKVEDQLAMDQLGVDYIWLDYPEAMFRSRRPLSLFKDNVCDKSGEKPLCNTIYSGIFKICENAKNKHLYLPFGIGGHRDHLITFQAGLNLIKENRVLEICFYEEVPYTFIAHLLKYRIKQIGIENLPTLLSKGMLKDDPFRKEITAIYKSVAGLPLLGIKSPLEKTILFLFLFYYVMYMKFKYKPQPGELGNMSFSPECIDVTREADQKLDVILKYRSQVLVLFGGNDEDIVKRYFLDYSKKICKDEDKIIERYWRLSK